MKTKQGQIEKLVGQAVAQIMEHASSVQILVTTREENGDTGCFADGGGDLYARLCHAREWLARHDQTARQHAIKPGD